MNRWIARQLRAVPVRIALATTAITLVAYALISLAVAATGPPGLGAPVGDAGRSALLRAQISAAPVLVILVFAGALIIGRRAAAPIERARRQQLEFTADASHELRTPLSVIEAEVSLALADAETSEATRAALERVSGESKRLRRLVEDLLWLARMDSAEAAPAFDAVDVGAIAAATVERFHAVAQQRRITLDAAVETAEPATVWAPAAWLDRLAGVLVDNACRYAPDGGHVSAGVTTDDTHVTLRVDDDGPGIPVAARARVLDRFHRATDTPGGSGLGLAIADAVVRTTGGRWEIGDSPLGGARLAVTWHRRSLT